MQRDHMGVPLPHTRPVTPWNKGRFSPATVQKWRKRTTTADAAMSPRDPRSTVLTPEQEAIAVAFRRHTLLLLDGCLYALQPTIPHPKQTCR